jgi:hypothetical protein
MLLYAEQMKSTNPYGDLLEEKEKYNQVLGGNWRRLPPALGGALRAKSLMLPLDL